MRGNVNYQVQELYKGVEAIGASKHEAKAECRAGGASTWHEVGQGLGIHSYSTADSYRAVWRHVGDFAKAEHGVKDLEKLTGEHVRGYLESKIAENVAASTFASYASACEKLGVALEKYAVAHETGRSYQDEKTGFSAQISESRSQATELEKFDRSRAYERPVDLVRSVDSEKHQLAAAIQYEAGTRIHETSQIKESQLKGIRPDSITGQQKGYVEVKGKGGKIREIGMSPGTYNRLVGEIKSSPDRQFKISEDAYDKAVRSAAGVSGQNAEGSHGLRWSYAQERHQELQKNGLSYEESLSKISSEMGHDRQDITEHYLR